MPIKSQLWEAIIFHTTLHNSYGKLKDFYQYPLAFISVQSFSMDFCNYIPTKSVCGYAYSLFKNPYRAKFLCTDHFNFLLNYATSSRPFQLRQSIAPYWEYTIHTSMQKDYWKDRRGRTLHQYCSYLCKG